jgi:2-polyprenyl-3-methyl-5-hydroxy-6-metoxy-1,4-benzoquinol methylase
MRQSDRSYAAINSGHAEDSFTERRYRVMARALPPGCLRIMDVGCARAFGGRLIKEAFPRAELVGVDCCEEKIAVLPASVYRYGLVAESLSHIPSSLRVDGIVVGEMIEHLKEEDVSPFLAACFHRLNTGGRLVITTPNPDYLWIRIRRKRVTDTETHQSEHNVRNLAQRLEAVGFRNMRSMACGRISALIGPWFWRLLPSLYGAYMIVAEKICYSDGTMR